MRKKLRRCLVPSTSCWSCRGWETRSQTGICPSPSADGFINANNCVLTLPSNVTFNRFTVCQWNCSINTNLDQLVQHVSRHQFEVVCLQSLACPPGNLPRLEGYYYPPVVGPVSPRDKVMDCIYIVLFSNEPNITGPPNGYTCGVRVRVQGQLDFMIVNCYTPQPCTSFDWLTELGGKGRCLVTGDLRPGQQLGAGLRVLITHTHRPDRQQWLHRVERWIFHPHTWPLGSEAVGYRPDPRDSRHSQRCGVGSRCGFFVARPPARPPALIRLLSRGDSCYHKQVQLRPGQLGLVQEPSGNLRDKRRRWWPRRSEPTNSLLHSGSRQGSYPGDRWWAFTVE